MPRRRSSLLFHWTGKGISLERRALSDEQRQEYVEMLRSILNNGLWLSFCLEVAKFERGVQSWGPRMACFTETRISEAGEHASSYGLLGLGFEREFVLRFHGSPVHYVRGRPPDSLMKDLSDLISWLSNRRGQAQSDQEREELLSQFHKAYHVLAFMKPMTESGSSAEDFELLHEHEWRIIHTRGLEPQLRLIQQDVEKGPLWGVPVSPDDVRILVVPDAATRGLARDDPHIQAFFGPSMPPVLTLQEASEF